MTAPFERFGLVINNRIIKTPIAIASMAGIVNAAYLLQRTAHIGIGFIGGYSIDSRTIDASREMAAAGRSEFLIGDLLGSQCIIWGAVVFFEILDLPDGVVSCQQPNRRYPHDIDDEAP
jgi:hypothetical protein